MDNIRNVLINNLKYLVKSRGMSQTELAERIGISKGAVTNWMRGANTPDIEILAKICEIYGITFSELFYIDIETGEKNAPAAISDQRENKLKSVKAKLGLMNDDQLDRLNYLVDLITCPPEDFELVQSIANLILNRIKNQ